MPESVDKSGAPTATIARVNIGACVDNPMRQNKYLNNAIDRVHRAIKRIA